MSEGSVWEEGGRCLEGHLLGHGGACSRYLPALLCLHPCEREVVKALACMVTRSRICFTGMLYPTLDLLPSSLRFSCLWAGKKSLVETSSLRPWLGIVLTKPRRSVVPHFGLPWVRSVPGGQTQPNSLVTLLSKSAGRPFPVPYPGGIGSWLL